MKSNKRVNNQIHEDNSSIDNPLELHTEINQQKNIVNQRNINSSEYSDENRRKYSEERTPLSSSSFSTSDSSYYENTSRKYSNKKLEKLLTQAFEYFFIKTPFGYIDLYLIAVIIMTYIKYHFHQSNLRSTFFKTLLTLPFDLLHYGFQTLIILVGIVIGIVAIGCLIMYIYEYHDELKDEARKWDIENNILVFYLLLVIGIVIGIAIIICLSFVVTYYSVKCYNNYILSHLPSWFKSFDGIE